MKRPALCRELNRAVLQLAPAFTVSDHAPSTFPGIIEAPGVIWSGGSDNTVYGDPHVNHAFRAWHDEVHRKHGYDFSYMGECRTAWAQMQELRTRWPNVSPLALRIVFEDVIGQAAYKQYHGEFPADQYQFVLDRVKASL